MKTQTKLAGLAFIGAALSAVSCSTLSQSGDFLECVTAANREECIIGKGMEKVVAYLADAKNIDSVQKADQFAAKWEKAQVIINQAHNWGFQVPESVKKTYNDTLSRVAKHKFFNSDHLKQVMANAQYLK